MILDLLEEFIRSFAVQGLVNITRDYPFAAHHVIKNFAGFVPPRVAFPVWGLSAPTSVTRLAPQLQHIREDHDGGDFANQTKRVVTRVDVLISPGTNTSVGHSPGRQGSSVSQPRCESDRAQSAPDQLHSIDDLFTDDH